MNGHHRIGGVASLVLTTAATVAIIVAGCAAPTASSVPSPAPTGSVARTFPPSQTPIEPGPYRWDGFGPAVSIELGPGWDLGHDDPSFFDLFRGSTFPSVSFARFTDVYADGKARVAAVDAASVVTTLRARSDLALTGESAIETDRLTGRQFDVSTLAPQTPLFFGPAGDFRLDPEFKTRYRVLDFPGGGILVIGVHANAAEFDDAVAIGDPLVATMTVAR